MGNEALQSISLKVVGLQAMCRSEFRSTIAVFLRPAICTLFSLSIVMSVAGPESYADEDNTSVRSSPYFQGGKAKIEKKSASGGKPAKVNNLTVPQIEHRMFESINQDRVKCGVPALKQNAVLAKVARELADDMQKHGFFGDTTSGGLDTQKRAKQAGINCGVYENIGSQSGPDPAADMVEEIERSFMAEPPEEANHRYVLLYPQHQYVGIGISKLKNTVIVVQDFTDVDPTPSNQN
jgi:uncharacterized protein YkwD